MFFEKNSCSLKKQWLFLQGTICSLNEPFVVPSKVGSSFSCSLKEQLFFPKEPLFLQGEFNFELTILIEWTTLPKIKSVLTNSTAYFRVTWRDFLVTWRYFLVPEGTFWYLRVLLGTWGYYYVSEGTFGYLKVLLCTWGYFWYLGVLLGIWGYFWVYEGTFGYLKVLFGTWGYFLISEGTFGYFNILLGTWGHFWVPIFSNKKTGVLNSIESTQHDNPLKLDVIWSPPAPVVPTSWLNPRKYDSSQPDVPGEWALLLFRLLGPTQKHFLRDRAKLVFVRCVTSCSSQALTSGPGLLLLQLPYVKWS